MDLTSLFPNGYCPSKAAPAGHAHAIGAPSPWTTSRCNRLLRPLVSRLAQLEATRRLHPELSASPLSLAGMQPPAASSKVQPRRVRCGGGPTLESASDSGEEDDPKWVPDNAQTRRVRQRYSRRNTDDSKSGPKAQQVKKDGGKAPAPGELLIPAQVIQRLQDQPVLETLRTLEDFFDAVPSVPPQPEAPQPRGSPEDFLLKASPRLRHTYSNIYTSLTNILSAATPRYHLLQPGTRSLLSTAISRMPDLISLETASSQLTSSGPTSVLRNKITMEIFSSLEELGGGDGWAPLCEVARAQAISLLCDAISSGLLIPRFACRLVRRCLLMGYIKESEELCEALVNNMPCLRGPVSVDCVLFNSHTSFVLRTLMEFAKICSRTAFFYRQLSFLLENKKIPYEWLATRDFSKVLLDALDLVTKREKPEAECALEFLGFILKCLIRGDENLGDSQAKTANLRMAPALANSTSSLLSFLSSMVILEEPSQGEAIGSSDRFIRRRLARTAAHLLHAVSRSISLSRCSKGPWGEVSRSPLVLLADIICNRTRPKPSLLTLLSLLSLPLSSSRHSSRNAQRRWLVLLMINTAKYCGLAHGGDGFVYIKKFLSHLMSLLDTKKACATPSQRTTLGTLVWETAFEAAEQGDDASRFAWAQDMQVQVNAICEAYALEPDTPGPRQTKPKMYPMVVIPARKTNYRWEQGISEWVARTPAHVLWRGSGKTHAAPKAPAPASTDNRRLPSMRSSQSSCSTAVSEVQMFQTPAAKRRTPNSPALSDSSSSFVAEHSTPQTDVSNSSDNSSVVSEPVRSPPSKKKASFYVSIPCAVAPPGQKATLRSTKQDLENRSLRSFQGWNKASKPSTNIQNKPKRSYELAEALGESIKETERVKRQRVGRPRYVDFGDESYDELGF
ncbi:MAG: hypothetical protein M1829_006010 [Trizodia sp. TS-e1964]|nr:MAG: hypothetical protein M1829_006010 [Trizodia sp. TS-e1964]